MTEDWERYASEHVHFLDESVSSTLVKYLTTFRWRVFLDVGCGDGSLLFALDRRGFFKDKVVSAVDISAKRIEAVRGINSSFRCCVDDACKLESIEGDSVDMLVSLQVIEHVPSDDAMVQQIHRVLAQDGVAYITTVFKKPWSWYIYRNSSGESVIDPTHVREYKDDQLLRLFEEHGFEVLESRKTQERKAILGASILGRIGASKESLIKHPFLKVVRRIKFPVPGYFNWEIVVKKKGV